MALTNAITNLHRNNLDWSNTINIHIDNNIIRQEDLILDNRWKLQHLDSDAEVPRTIRLQSSKLEELLVATSQKHQLLGRRLGSVEVRSTCKGCTTQFQRAQYYWRPQTQHLPWESQDRERRSWTRQTWPNSVAKREDSLDKLCCSQNRPQPSLEIPAKNGKPLTSPMEQKYGSTLHQKEGQKRGPNSKSNLEKVSRTKKPTKSDTDHPSKRGHKPKHVHATLLRAFKIKNTQHKIRTPRTPLTIQRIPPRTSMLTSQASRHVEVTESRNAVSTTAQTKNKTSWAILLTMN